MVCREGNKRGLAGLIIELIPDHNMYIEPFCGMGGVFLAKPRAKYNILNDHDDFVYDFWTCLAEDKERLLKEIDRYPNYQRILKKETDDKFQKTAKKLLSIENSFFGYPQGERGAGSNAREILIQRITEFILGNTNITNMDFRKFIKSIHFSRLVDRKKCFIYNDPPYLISKGSLKENKGWSLKDLIDLIEINIDSRCNFMISEMNNTDVIELFKSYGLNIHFLKQNKIDRTFKYKKEYKKQKIEIVATNYKIDSSLF